jgi:glycosyltransferase involved in cell wall biosynthesis
MTQVVNGYLRWPYPTVDVRVIRSRDGSLGLRALLLFAQAFIRILTIGSPRHNVVVFHLSQGGSFVREGLLLRLARARGLGTIAHLHGSRFVDYSRDRPARVRRVLQAATKVIVLSEATRDAVLQFVPPARVELVPNAVPSVEVTRKEPLVVFGGSVSRRKGIDLLISAWRAVGAGSDWRLVIAGPVSEPDLLLDVPSNCEAAGPLAHDDLMRLLERSAIAVLPSRDEAMPMFILEALARRNCVVSTRVGGIPAVLGDGAGVLIDSGAVDQLRDALSRLMQDAEYRERIAAKGHESFERSFSAAAIYPRVEALWNNVMHNPAPTSHPA